MCVLFLFGCFIGVCVCGGGGLINDLILEYQHNA